MKRRVVVQILNKKYHFQIEKTDGEQAKHVQMEKKGKKARKQWEKKRWHLSTQELAGKQALKGQPSFLTLSHTRGFETRSQQKGH
jgi:hypothetical protein